MKASDKANDNLITLIWNTLLERIHKFLSAFGIISQQSIASDLFKGIKTGKYMIKKKALALFSDI